MSNRKIGIIGAGISGMSIARLLKDDFEVEVLEKFNNVGGIAKTKDVGGKPYHINGGHCFNSKFDDVLDFVFNTVLDKDKWNYLPRKAEILFKNNWVTYPIEFSIKEIDSFDTSLAFQITKEMFNASYEKGKNLEEWFINHFGLTLAKEYFIPYNTKIWGIAPKNMDNVWIEDEKQMKLPVPTKESFYKSLVGKITDKMSHAAFYYPKTNNQNTFIEAIGEGVDILTNYDVKDITKENNQWIVNGEKKYDILINTSPLDLIPQILKNIPIKALSCFNKLKYNKVTNIFWETDGSLDITWGYIPDPSIGFHRISNTGSIVQPKGNFCTTEAIGEIPYDRLVEEGQKIPFLKKPLDYNVTEHAYVFFDLNYTKAKTGAISYLDSLGIYSHGRFGEWEYYNMDVCIKRSIDLAKNIKEKYKG
ncbi:TPA: NAD(P)-binding protein [Campylobacter coli]|uniref:protoporphyrinogen/coproporphyrinogen oxidase n=1 Tax=Campylobacter coli TaxID=195 RepID=UPI000873E313|nr:NAD(P)-binding protein [Campylobacter coli]EAH4814224.1 nucleotidyl-sugar pyranose mutase [Campylobacter coli]EAH5859582.1 nucleotidyl-sugar pyranose mutase [Campylobacter coli]EAH6259374.1 nucleotidyl-sugar pyranose mutase [Campylobacter coli]EAH7223699.1 nucleotidyl-sugar pyranose mutase [Campylobacter coli]EAI0043451.1 nucleotidyl-sugar pyranose mutase [Campylobacter coli]